MLNLIQHLTVVMLNLFQHLIELSDSRFRRNDNDKDYHTPA